MQKKTSAIGQEKVQKKLQQRYKAEKRFRRLGLLAVLTALSFLTILLISISSKGYTAFQQTYIKLDIPLTQEVFDVKNLANADYPGLVKASLRQMFPEVKGRRDKRKLYGLVSTGAAFKLQDFVITDPTHIGK